MGRTPWTMNSPLRWRFARLPSSACHCWNRALRLVTRSTRVTSTSRLRARLRALGGPAHVGAARVAPGVGQADPDDEPVARAHGVLDEGGVDLREAELAPAEQAQRAVSGHVTPGEADMAVRAVAADERAAEVEAFVAAADGHRDLPPGPGRGAGDRLGCQPPVVGDDQG